MFDNLPHHLIAEDLSRFQSRKVSRVVAGYHRLQAVSNDRARRLAVVIAYRAQHQYALEIHATGLTQEGERLHRAGVFHG